MDRPGLRLLRRHDSLDARTPAGLHWARFYRFRAKFQFLNPCANTGGCANIPLTPKRDWRPIMPENQRRVYPPAGDGEVTQASSENGVIRRRDFIRTGASGLAGAALAAAGCNRVSENQNARPLGNLRSATPAELQGLVGDGRRRRILLRGGVVLTLDARLGDFEKADILIDGKTIAEIAPTISASDLRSSTARARSSCLGSSRRIIISTKRCSAATFRMDCFRAHG